MSKVLVSYQFDADKELGEDLWTYRTFGASWTGKSTDGKTIIVTMALEPKDALFLRLNRITCPTPPIWQNALTEQGGVK